MERLLVFVPRRPKPPILRFGTAVGVVAVSFLLLIGLHQTGGPYDFYLLYPAVFFCTIAFGESMGYLAAGLETVVLYVLLRIPGSLYLPRGYLLSLALFIVLATALTWASGGLRSAWERAVEAERGKDLLLQELGHRTKNNLAMVHSVLSLQARASNDPEIRNALQTALSRVHAISAAHEHVQRGQANGATDMRAYLEELCHQVGDALRGIRPIAITAEVEKLDLPTAQAVPLGLIVNELVTNALKYAFPGDRPGTIWVRLQRRSAITVTVEDDGVGCEPSAPEGAGSRLVQLLVQQLHGTLSRKKRDPGCLVSIELQRSGQSDPPRTSKF
jgi:two-component sensor histidine kinase